MHFYSRAKKIRSYTTHRELSKIYTLEIKRNEFPGEGMAGLEISKLINLVVYHGGTSGVAFGKSQLS